MTHAAKQALHSWLQVMTEIVEIIKDAVAAAPADQGLDSFVERCHSRGIVGSHADAEEGDSVRVYFRSRDDIVDTGLARYFVIGTCFNSLQVDGRAASRRVNE